MRRSLEEKLRIQHYVHWVQLLLDPIIVNRTQKLIAHTCGEIQ